MRRRPRAVVSLVAIAAIAAAGCTRPEDREAQTDATIPPPSTAAPTTTPPTTAPDTSDPSTSTDAPPNTTPPTTSTPSSTPSSTPASSVPATTAVTTTDPITIDGPGDLTLAADGILPLRLGSRDVEVVPTLTAVFGDPTADRSIEYPVAESGLFLTDDGEEAYIAPFGRTVCWDDALCAEFGAGAPETLIFTGWALRDADPDDAVAELETEDGVRIGSVLADVADVVTYDPALACFQVANGFAGGVEVELLSGDGVFSSPDPDGDGVVVREPDPSRVDVRALAAGERPFPVFADC